MGAVQRVLVTLIANAVALAVAAALFDGIRVGEADAVQQIVTLLLVGGVLGIVNAIVTPIVRLLSLPLIVLTRVVPQDADLPPELRAKLPPDFPWDAIETVWQELQAELAALVPGARQVIATESGHYIQVEQPELVIEAVRQVVEAVRDPDTWATPAASPSPAA